jgi:CheY-like chemotaxis protein
MSTYETFKIILVDDDPIANMISARILERNFSCKVISFTNPLEALKQLTVWSGQDIGDFPAVIFLDINMPLIDGWEFLAEYEKFPTTVLEKCPVIMLTSSIDYDDIRKSKDYKCVQDFISKPLTHDKLLILTDIHKPEK